MYNLYWDWDYSSIVVCCTQYQWPSPAPGKAASRQQAATGGLIVIIAAAVCSLSLPPCWFCLAASGVQWCRCRNNISLFLLEDDLRWQQLTEAGLVSVVVRVRTPLSPTYNSPLDWGSSTSSVHYCEPRRPDNKISSENVHNVRQLTSNHTPATHEAR